MAAIDLCISPINLLDAVEGARAGLNHVRGASLGYLYQAPVRQFGLRKASLLALLFNTEFSVDSWMSACPLTGSVGLPKFDVLWKYIAR